ncbi:hypothetical protein IWW56_003982 [Coemansia sp. RSA 2131]|nr:hypothetical protein IWW56_003982 [Coemansia sp. RSA 2131]
MLPSLSIFLGRSQRPQVGVFSGTPHKPAPHLGVSLLFEDIKAAPAHTRPGARTMTTESSADRTFAIVKPDALTPFKFQQIDALIKLNEFETIRQKLIWLSEDQAEALFPGRAAEDDGREWLQYITGAPCLALELAKPDAPLFWQLTMGADDPASGARDSDSIRGILAVDRIRNAVDGSQEPEDAAKQLELVFSDAVPALDYNNFLMQRADDTHATLALIKPDISRNEDAVAHVIGRAIARGYTIKDRVELTLSRAQATAFYAEHEDKPFFAGLIEFMTSGPVIALLLDGDDAVRGWRMMIGPSDPDTARQQVPQSIRAKLGAGSRQNAVHGSDSVEAAHREIGLFFFPRIQPELDEPAASAVDDKKKKKKKRRSKRKQAVTAGGAPEAPAGNAAALSDASDDEPELDPVPEADVDMGDDVDVSDSAVELVRPSDPAYERTFALIKPDAYPRHSKQLIKHILAKGLAVVAQEEVVLTPAVAANIYSDMSTFPVFSRLVEFVTSGPSLALVLEGVDAVSVWRELVGPTNPRTAKFEARNSLRAKYGTTAQMNAVHASKDLAEAQKSIKAVFYGLLDGKFHVLQPSDDPLAVDADKHATVAAEETTIAPEEATVAPEETTIATEETTVAPEETTIATEETTIATEELTKPAANDHLVHQMQSLVVADQDADKKPEAPVESEISKDIASVNTMETVVQSTDEAAAVDTTQVSNTNGSVVDVAETASANNDDAVSVVSEKADTPLTPPQTRSATGEKSSLFGSRLASSPFLKADRHPGQDAGATPKRVGRIKSPFLGGENSNQIPADTGSKDTPTLANDNAKPSDRDTQLHEQMADLRIGAEAQEAVEANDAQESEAEQSQAEQEKSEPEQPVVERDSQSDDEKTTPLQELEEKAEPQVLATEAPAAEKTPSKTAAPKTAPKSAAVPRTVRRVPGSGPPVTASPGSGPAARRATLGPAPTTLRARPVRAAPATPSVTTRSAARASQATPLSATPSSSRPSSVRPAAVSSSAAPGAVRRTSLGASRTTPTRAPVGSAGSARPAATPVTPTRASGPATRTRVAASASRSDARPVPSASRPEARSTLSAASSRASSRAAPEKSGTTGTRVRPDPAATTPTATRRVTALGAANGAQASPARKAVAPAPGASMVSPRPVTRSMTGGVPVASTAASRARAAAAVAARSATRTPTSSAAPAKPASRTTGSRLTAPTAASRARASGAAAAAKKAPEAEATQAED